MSAGGTAARLQSVMLMVNELSSATRFYSKGLGLPVLHQVRSVSPSQPLAQHHCWPTCSYHAHPTDGCVVLCVVCLVCVRVGCVCRLRQPPSWGQATSQSHCMPHQGKTTPCPTTTMAESCVQVTLAEALAYNTTRDSPAVGVQLYTPLTTAHACQRGTRAAGMVRDSRLKPRGWGALLSSIFHCVTHTRMLLK